MEVGKPLVYYASEDSGKLIRELDSQIEGLSHKEAFTRLKKYG